MQKGVRREFLKSITVDEAKTVLCENFREAGVGTEEIDTRTALGRVLAEDVVSDEDLPNFSRSTMDGFAVRSIDVQGASSTLPVHLRLKGEIQMGERPNLEVLPGDTVRIPTGGMLPPETDSVVMIEDTECFGDVVEVKRGVGHLGNVVSPGEDIGKGEVVLRKGDTITAQSIGMLCGIGKIRVLVYKKLKVGIISTGQELVPPDQNPEQGKIRDSNSYLLGSWVSSSGTIPNYYGIVKDDFSELRATTLTALVENDIVLIIGGSSIGARDVTAEVIDSLGKPGILVHGISMKPGRPTIIGKVKGRPIIGLPGHPASCAVVYTILVRRLVEMLQGVIQRRQFPIFARLTKKIPSCPGREDYVRVRIELDGEEYKAEPIYTKSAFLKSLVCADGLARIPEGVEGVHEGDRIEVILF